MKCCALTLLVGSAVAGCAGAPRAAAGRLDELLRVRESVWRAWFGNDRATLERLLPADFVAIDPSGAVAKGPQPQLDGAAGFARSGGRLLELEFPVTEVQWFGDVAVIYTTFALTLETPTGRQQMKGRATEVFEQRDGVWVHPGWHMDTTDPDK